MSEEEKKQERLQIALFEEATQKIDRWRTQVANKCNVELSRRVLLNWYVSKSPENLSSSDLAQITQKFYDEEKFLKSLLLKVKRAKQSGIEAEVEVVVRQRKFDRKEIASEEIPEEGEST